MPLTAGGKLSIVASSDLGALGSKEGLPVTYNWVLPSVAPLLLPWLVILGLLALKPNRCAAAWLIWLPLGCCDRVHPGAAGHPAIGNKFFPGCHRRAGGGSGRRLAPVKLSPAATSVRYFPVRPARLGGFQRAGAVSRQGWSFTPETLVTGIVLAVGVLASAAALSLGGLICRGRYRPLGLYVWLLILLAAVWLADCHCHSFYLR